MKIKTVLTAIFSLLFVNPAFSQSSSECFPPSPYVVGFFNGVFNTDIEARIAREFIRNIVGDRYNGQSVSYRNFYNQTSKESVNRGLSDIKEVFIQRAAEAGVNYITDTELFWLSRIRDADLLENWINNAETQQDLIASLYDEITQAQIDLSNDLVADPPLIEDYANHRGIIDQAQAQDSMFLFFAHSQGNLFVNQAIAYAEENLRYSNDNVGVVHIAPASPTTNGPHILAEEDIIINGLRIADNFFVPANTLSLFSSYTDFDRSGHTLLNIYLNPQLNAVGQVISRTNNEISRIVPPIAGGLSDPCEPDSTLIDFENPPIIFPDTPTDCWTEELDEYGLRLCNLEGTGHGTTTVIPFSQSSFSIDSRREIASISMNLVVGGSLANPGAPTKDVIVVGRNKENTAEILSNESISATTIFGTTNCPNCSGFGASFPSGVNFISIVDSESGPIISVDNIRVNYAE